MTEHRERVDTATDRVLSEDAALLERLRKRYLMVNIIVDPDNLRQDVGDLHYALERAICDEDSEDHECPLLVISSKGLTDEQHDLILEQNALELRAAGWIVQNPQEVAP